MELARQTVVSVVIPSLNEEHGIRQTINSLPLTELVDQGYVVEVIVVDGESSDATRRVAEDLGAKVITEKKRGYGRSYKTGFASAIGDIIVTMDADGTYPASRISEYIRKLEIEKLDFISVNRFSKLHQNSMGFSHLVGNKILSLAMKVIYSINVSDSQSGMWIFRRHFVESIKLYSETMALSEEIKIIAFKFFRAEEVDGEYSQRIGKAKLNTFGHGWENFKYLFFYRSLVNFATITRNRIHCELKSPELISKDNKKTNLEQSFF